MAACSPAGDETGAIEVTQSEAAALDEAAAMIEERRPTDDAIPAAEATPSPAPQETGA